MKQLFTIICSLFIFLSSSQAQDNLETTEISLLTCGVGDELYASFGHTAIRVKDELKGTDNIYNYGLFNFSDPDFYTKFVSGKLLYYVGKSPYLYFIEGYQEEQRNVIEHQLALTNEQKASMIEFLEENLKPENAYYHYDFLYDNCATRIRDIFPKILGANFKFGTVLPQGRQLSFRDIIDQYQAQNHWTRLGIDIILGSKIDKEMSNEDIMFLPDFLMKGIAIATLDGKPILKKEQVVYRGADRNAKTLNTPMWVFVLLLLATLIIFFQPKLQKFKLPLSFLLILITGALGCLLLFMWYGTDHQSCQNNYNILWAFPLNILFAFTLFKPRKWHIQYSLIAIALLLLSLLVHVIGIQRLPITELIPFLITMVYCYMYVYKRATAHFGSKVGSSVA
jgi:hypothetical protein